MFEDANTSINTTKHLTLINKQAKVCYSQEKVTIEIPKCDSLLLKARNNRQSKGTSEIEKYDSQLCTSSNNKSSSSPITFSQNEEVLAFDGIWMYPANILSIEPAEKQKKNSRTTYNIHYRDWPDSEDETVTSDRMMKLTNEVRSIKAQIESLDETFHAGMPGYAQNKVIPQLTEFIQGEKVFVYSNQMYTAKIIDIKHNGINPKQYKVSYHGWSKTYNEWLENKSIFKITPTSEEIKNKLKRYEKPSKVATSSQICKQKSMNKKVKETVLKELIPSKRKNEHPDKYHARSLFVNSSNTQAINHVLVDNDFEKYVSKRSMSKNYEKQISIRDRRIQDLELQVKELKFAAVYHHCQKCKQHYASFQGPRKKME